MTMLLHTHQHQQKLQNRVQLASEKVTSARSDKNRKHNYPRTRKPRTIDYKKKIINDDFIFSV